MEISFLRKMTSPKNVEYTTIKDVAKDIKIGKYSKLISQIRESASMGDLEAVKSLKIELPAFFGCYFKGYAITEDIKYIKYVIIDFDDVTATLSDLNVAIRRANESKHTLLSFVSPSGLGIKIVVELPEKITDIQYYAQYWDKIRIYYESLTGLNADSNCKDARRGCFYSYDDKAYYNPDAEPFPKIKYEPPAPLSQKKDLRLRYADNPDALQEACDHLSRQKLVRSDWVRLAYALLTVQNGRDYFIQMSLDNPHYNDTEAELARMWANCERTARGDIGVGTIYYLASAIYPNFKNYTYKIPEVVKKQRIVDTIDVETGKIVPTEIYQYWDTKLTSKGLPTITIQPHYLYEFLMSHGFHNITITNMGKQMMGQIINKRVFEKTEQDIKNFVVKFNKSLPEVLKVDENKDGSKTIYTNVMLINEMSKQQYLSAAFNSKIENVDITFMRDKANVSYFYYDNCYVEINKEGVTQKSYKLLEWYIWDKQVIKRKFNLPDEHLIDKAIDDSEFRKFIAKVTHNDPRRYLSMKTAIGYLLHTYKDEGNSRAVIFMDENISFSANVANGGTGKSLIGKAIGQIRNVIQPDGKNFNFSSDFAFQQVDPSVEIFHFNDARQDLKFEHFFSFITDGMTVNKKNEAAYTIPFDMSPKILISTNYTIKGTGSSYDRRKLEVELYPAYTDKYVPEDDFGHLFFSGWDEDEWLRFDLFMMDCVRTYLDKGIVTVPSGNIKINRAIANTSEEFNEFMELLFTNQPIEFNVYMNDLYADFVDAYPHIPKQYATPKTIKDYFVKWCTERGITVPKITHRLHRDRSGATQTRPVYCMRNTIKYKEI